MKLVSVPYTGTRFLRNLLVSNGYTPDEEIHTFVQAKWHHWFTTDQVVCPMRDPVLHAISVVNREKPADRIRFDEFDLLASLATPDTHFFRVDVTDTDDRKQEVDSLAEWLGAGELVVDWSPIGSRDDVSGMKAEYLETGRVPHEEWLAHIGGGTRTLLKRLGYTMAWLEAGDP